MNKQIQGAVAPATRSNYCTVSTVDASATNTSPNPSRILRMKQLIDRTNLSRATLYVLMSKDLSFPRKIKLTERSIGFLESEVNEWIAHRAQMRAVAA